MSNLVLGLDLEGINANLQNGVDTKVDRVIEIGAVLWDWKKNAPLKLISELVNEPDRLPISSEVQLVTGIDDDMLENWALKGEDIRKCLENLANLMNKADVIMAHNGGNYDFPMIKAMFSRYGIEMPNVLWVDTMNDIEYPPKISARSMAMLEHSHGFVNPFPHRAVTDVLAMLKVASNYSLDRMVTLAKSPKVTLTASLNAPNWKNKEEVEKFNVIKNKVAKSRFKWNPSTKKWLREVPQVLLDEGKIKLDFDYKVSTN